MSDLRLGWSGSKYWSSNSHQVTHMTLVATKAHRKRNTSHIYLTSQWSLLFCTTLHTNNDGEEKETCVHTKTTIIKKKKGKKWYGSMYIFPLVAPEIMIKTKISNFFCTYHIRFTCITMHACIYIHLGTFLQPKRTYIHTMQGWIAKQSIQSPYRIPRKSNGDNCTFDPTPKKTRKEKRAISLIYGNCSKVRMSSHTNQSNKISATTTAVLCVFACHVCMYVLYVFMCAPTLASPGK